MYLAEVIIFLFLFFLSLQVYSGSGQPRNFGLIPAFPNRRDRGGYRRCGGTIPEPVSSTGNEMTVYMRTDRAVANRGFRANWTTDQLAGRIGTWHFIVRHYTYIMSITVLLQSRDEDYF